MKRDSIYIKIGQQIDTLRHKRGLSQEGLASEAGLARTYVGEIERGLKRVSIEALYKLAQALHISLSELFHSIE